MPGFFVFYLILIFSISYLTCIYLIPYVCQIGLQFNVLDKKEERKLNFNNQVRLGGLSIIIPFYLSIFLSYLTNSFNYQLLNLDFGQVTPLIIVIIAGSLSFYTLGLCDDLFTLSPYLRLAIQIIIILILISFGLIIDINGFFEKINIANNSNLEYSLSILLTVIFIAGIINSFNWIDGLDGLASGVTCIVSLGYLAICLLEGNSIVAIFAASIAGASLGFLKYNFHPSKLIMGDGGSYFIGFMNSIIGLMTICPNQSSNLINLSFDKAYLNFSFDNLYILFIVLFLPIFDMFIVIVRRIFSGKSPFYPDRTHLHHLFFDKGLSQKRTVIFIYSVTQFCVCMAINLNNIKGNYSLTLYSSIFLVVMSFLIFPKSNFSLHQKK